MLKGTILVGHALFNDLAAMEYRHVYEDMRDTALFMPFRSRMGVKHEGKYPSLKLLAKEALGRDIQANEHSPVRVT